jgi:c-di-GMP-binding flagellar brake protein YcgR
MPQPIGSYKKEFRERRRFPRVNAGLPLKIRSVDYDFVTETRNISCIGAYFTINKYIEPLTKVSIVLLLPKRNPDDKTAQKIQCTGVVIRAEANTDGRFNVAVFFNDIKERDKQKISQYVKQIVG